MTSLSHVFRCARLAGCAVLLGAVAAVLPVATTTAAGVEQGELLIDVAGDGAGFVHATDQPWLDVERLAPGSVETREVVLWNTTSFPAALHLSAMDLVDHENSCIRPEQQVAGEECDADGGELSRWLTLEATPSGAESTQTAPDAPTLRELAETAHQVPTTIGPGEKLPLTLRLRFSPESGNDTMTDSVEFNTAITASHEGTEPAVLGIEESLGGPAQGTDQLSVVGSNVANGDNGVSALGQAVGLPMTGGTVPLWVLLLDLAVLALGAGLVVAGRRARHAPLAC